MNKYFLGVELGSTRIKAVKVNEKFEPVSSGDYTWKSEYRDGIWTYSLDEVWRGLRRALSGVENVHDVCAAGVSAMMHGYLAFDKDWNLLVPFRTWQNTITGEAAEKLTALFGFNIPQRWSIAHLYQAVLNDEPHTKKIAHITTLAGYVHYMLTGVNAVGIGEASGMFPVDGEKFCYNEKMLEKFEKLTEDEPWNIRDVLPGILRAGESAGFLTKSGENLLGSALKEGTAFAPPEGDAGTGMTATNSVAPGTGNVSAGTSIFSMVALSRPLSKVYPEIDIVATPAGTPVAMVHCNNCTNDFNAWAGVLREAAELCGAKTDIGVFYDKLYEKSLEGESDCGGVTVYNYLAGEGVTGLDEGRPMVVRKPDSVFNLANFIRAQLYSTLATLKIGMDILSDEKVVINSLTGHGGLFKAPKVGQKYLAAAVGAPVTCLKTAGEGGPYGMALLTAYMVMKSDAETLEGFLSRVFMSAEGTTVTPDETDAAGFRAYLEKFKNGLNVQRAAIENI